MFRLALSIEKERWAHETLRLRAYRRLFEGEAPAEYHAVLRGELTTEYLFATDTEQVADAKEEAWQLELSGKPETAQRVREKVATIVASGGPWVLIGGPPCQAYSLMGRARNRGKKGYVAEEDHRQTLYVEYLQILADHAPPVFVMENVKGLLSANLRGERLFERIRVDLNNPAEALKRERRKAGRQPRYSLHSFVPAGDLFGPLKPSDFIVQAEDYGVPQARHRVILLGVLDGFREPEAPIPCLTRGATAPVGTALHNLPRVRSGLSRGNDSSERWHEVLAEALKRQWFKSLPASVRKEIRHAVGRATGEELSRGADYLRTASGDVILNHSTRSHMAKDLQRYLFASGFAKTVGRSPRLADFPKSLLPAHQNVQRGVAAGHFSDRFRVQLESAPSSTITSHISKDGHYYIHYDPSQCRSLTVREAARLQTFPDDYFFCGPRTAQYQQVGNAVPPALAAQLAGIVARLL